MACKRVGEGWRQNAAGEDASSNFVSHLSFFLNQKSQFCFLAEENCVSRIQMVNICTQSSEIKYLIFLNIVVLETVFLQSGRMLIYRLKSQVAKL